MFDFDEARTFLELNRGCEKHDLLYKNLLIAEEYDYAFMFLQEEEDIKRTFQEFRIIDKGKNCYGLLRRCNEDMLDYGFLVRSNR